MSSSAERNETLTWSMFRERAAPPLAELLSPASELATVLQRYRHDLDDQRVASREAVADANSAAAEQAALVFQLSSVLDRSEEALVGAGLTYVHRQLRVLRNQMTQAIARTGLRIIDPVGRPFDEVADMVQVIGWRHGPEFNDEIVAETIDPIVRHDLELVRPGRVIMGAPDKETM